MSATEDLPRDTYGHPRGRLERSAQLEAAFRKAGAADDNKLNYVYANLRDKLARCAFLFGKRRCEITPYSLPTLSLDVFSARIRRVYLSASADFKTDVIQEETRPGPDLYIQPESEVCRIMVIDGLPAGGSLIEKFQWEYLRMRNFYAGRIANRLVQLFGRINRGRKKLQICCCGVAN